VKEALELLGTVFVAMLVVLMIGAVPVLGCGGCVYLTSAAARAGWGE
jgi:hypothetical protein